MPLENHPQVPLLGALCVAEGLVSQAQLDVCLQLQASGPTTQIGQILRQQGYLSEVDLGRMLGQQSAFRRALVQGIERQFPAPEPASAAPADASPHDDAHEKSALQWEALTDDYRAYVRTCFAELRVFIDPVHTRALADMRFCARVETIKGVELAAANDMVSLSVARLWCEARYADLLRAELAHVGA